MSTFYTLLTKLGLAKLTNAQITQTKVNLSHVAVGDGNGAYYEPNDNMIALRKETWRGGTSRVGVATDNPNWIEIEVTVPANVGGFYIREVGVFDDTGTLIAIAKYPETYKPTVDIGSTKDLNIKFIIELNNTNSVEVKIDPHIITASRKYVDDKIAQSMGNVGDVVQEVKDGTITINPLQTTDKTLAGSINELKEKADENSSDLTTHLADDVLHYISVKVIKSNKDSEGVFTTVEHRRKSDDSLARKSVLSGGTSPQYTTRTITYYAPDGTSVVKTDTFTLSYDADGNWISEV